MPFTKFASFEVSEVLDVKGAPTQQRMASLDKLSDFSDYRTEDGYMYARIRAISSRVNKNHDGWPSVELAGDAEIFDRHTASEGFTIEASKDKKFGFSTFIGKPIFVDHNNSDPSRARGVIVDAKFHVEDQKTSSLDPYYSSPDVDPEHMPPSWVELLLEIDADRFPTLAKAIKEGSENPDKGIDGFSMGCDVEKTICNICSNTATAPDEFCDHIKMKGATFDFKDSSTGDKTSKKSYENCYGIKFFEISAVFDPADETALLRELVHKEGSAKEAIEFNPVDPNEAMKLAQEYIAKGVNPEIALDMASRALSQRMRHNQVKGDDGYVTPAQLPRHNFDALPQGFDPGPPRQGSYLQAKVANMKLADNPTPQSELTKAPEDVDTLRKEKICRICGSDMDEGKCEVCGNEDPPEGLNTPDLDRAEQFDLEQQEGSPMSEGDDPGEGQSYLDARKTQPTASVTGEMRWQPRDPRVSGRINTEERPIQPGSTPATDEPQETIVRDEPTPVTSSTRSAADLIAAAGQSQQENSMSDRAHTAAEPADPSGKPDKRVDVEGTGGVIDASNEQASKPENKHGDPGTGTTTDVTGKGGIIQDSNAEAAKPDERVDVEKEGEHQTSGPTTTWSENKNAPGVTDKAFPTAAATGNKPIGGPDVQPQRREDLEQESGFSNPQNGTDQWTGTGGNKVNRQADPVTKKVDPNIEQPRSSAITSHIVNVMKLADTEIELELIPREQKYDRIAELEQQDEKEVEARLDTLARVRTAGLRRQAAVTVHRLPSLAREAAVDPQPQEKTAKLDDERYDSAIFGL